MNLFICYILNPLNSELSINMTLAHQKESECVGPDSVCDFSFPLPAILDVFV